MGVRTQTVWWQGQQRSWTRLRLAWLWLRAVRPYAIHLLLALCLIEPLGCLLHCSTFVTPAALPASLHSMYHHPSRVHHTTANAGLAFGLASSPDPATPLVSQSSCTSYATAGGPFDIPAPLDGLFSHAHLLALALGVAVSIDLFWHSASWRPIHPPAPWPPPRLRRPPKFCRDC
jgi:hypothetical protein